MNRAGKVFHEEEILRALAAGGVVGNLIKTNASISGAECGCQAEIGSACSMASAALAELFGMEARPNRICCRDCHRASFGTTCDPIAGFGSDTLHREERGGGDARDSMP